MSWRVVQLSDGIHIRHGFAFKSKYFTDTGSYVVLTPGNFEEAGGFRLRPGKDRFYAGDIPEGFILGENDLIVAMTEQAPGLLGSSALIPDGGRYLHNQRLGLIDKIESNLFDKIYLYYLFNTRAVRQQISGSASGTKVRHTSPERIGRVKVAIPDTTTQQKAAQILRSYDFLIENNRRRIQLLEQAARLLYKEWFIHLRFPGNEHVKTKNGVPEGWERKPLGEVAPLQYGKGLREDNRIAGPYPVYGSSGILGTHQKPLRTGPAIIVGRKGNVGSIYWSERDFWPIDTVFYIESEKCSLYLFYALQHVQFISTDVAVPGLNRHFAHSRKIFWPDAGILRLFEGFVTPLYEQIATLARVNETLTQARDLLLPRMMKGEVAV